MKKLLTLLTVCLLPTASLLAQGRIAFSNTSATALRIWVPPSAPVVLGTASTASFGIGPASVQIRLYAGLTSSSLSPVLIGTAANQTFVLNTGSAIRSAQGTFAGGNPLPLPGYDGSAPVFIQMTVLSVKGPYLFSGTSPIISVTPAPTPAVATPVFSAAANPNAWDPFDVWYGDIMIGVPIPEPSALALLGMSFSLMFFARRRR